MSDDADARTQSNASNGQGAPRSASRARHAAHVRPPSTANTPAKSTSSTGGVELPAGWWQDRKGAFHPPISLRYGPKGPPITSDSVPGERSHSASRLRTSRGENDVGRRLAARVFLSLAIVVLVAGVVAASVAYVRLHDQGASGNEEAIVLGSILAGSVLGASVLAFFGFVLQLLTAMNSAARRTLETLDVMKDSLSELDDPQ